MSAEPEITNLENKERKEEEEKEENKSGSEESEESSSDEEQDYHSSDEENSQDSQNSEEYTEVPSTELYVISLDGVPRFYAKTEDEASIQSLKFAETLTQEPGKTMYIEPVEEGYRITSYSRTCWIRYETFEHLISFQRVTQVEF
jgi:hypothetical protein